MTRCEGFGFGIALYCGFCYYCGSGIERILVLTTILVCLWIAVAFGLRRWVWRLLYCGLAFFAFLLGGFAAGGFGYSGLAGGLRWWWFLWLGWAGFSVRFCFGLLGICADG